MLSFRIFGFAGFPRLFAGCGHSYPDLSDFRISPTFFAGCCHGCPDISEFSDYPMFFADCCHGCPDLPEFSDFPMCFADSGIGWSGSCHFHQLVAVGTTAGGQWGGGCALRKAGIISYLAQLRGKCSILPCKSGFFKGSNPHPKHVRKHQVNPAFRLSGFF